MSHTIIVVENSQLFLFYMRSCYSANVIVFGIINNKLYNQYYKLLLIMQRLVSCNAVMLSGWQLTEFLCCIFDRSGTQKLYIKSETKQYLLWPLKSGLLAEVNLENLHWVAGWHGRTLRENPHVQVNKIHLLWKLSFCCTKKYISRLDPQMKAFILGNSTELFLGKHVPHLPQRKL